MPSTLLGFFSGGNFIVSGNPYSGNAVPYASVLLRNSTASSGAVYIGMMSGAILPTGQPSAGGTITSGGNLSSGGMADWFEIPPGGNHTMPRLQCSGQIGKIGALVLPAASGFVRLFWDPI